MATDCNERQVRCYQELTPSASKIAVFFRFPKNVGFAECQNRKFHRSKSFQIHLFALRGKCASLSVCAAPQDDENPPVQIQVVSQCDFLFARLLYGTAHQAVFQNSLHILKALFSPCAQKNPSQKDGLKMGIFFRLKQPTPVWGTTAQPLLKAPHNKAFRYAVAHHRLGRHTSCLSLYPI